jgi:hypothetical protein
MQFSAAVLQAAVLPAALLAALAGAQPCPSPPTKGGYTPAVYKNNYDNHDCVCGPPLGLQKAERLQCTVDGDTVHVEGTVQCSADTWSCFAKNADPLNPDHDIFAELPAVRHTAAHCVTPPTLQRRAAGELQPA